MNPSVDFPLITVKFSVLNNTVSIFKSSFISFKTISSLVKTLCPETNFFHLGKKVWFPSAAFAIAVGKQPAVYLVRILVVKRSVLSPKPKLSLPSAPPAEAALWSGRRQPCSVVANALGPVFPWPALPTASLAWSRRGTGVYIFNLLLSSPDLLKSLYSFSPIFFFLISSLAEVIHWV